MTNKKIVDGEAQASLMKVRDALVLGSHSLNPETIRDLGRQIETILELLPRAPEEKPCAERMDPHRKCALTLGALLHAMDDWAVTLGAAPDTDEAASRRITESGGVLNYIAKVRCYGETALKETGYSKRNIAPFSG